MQAILTGALPRNDICELMCLPGPVQDTVWIIQHENAASHQNSLTYDV